MAASTYIVGNYAMVTTAAPVKVTTAAVVKTMLQVQNTKLMRIIEWGISFDGSAAATPINVELVDTFAIAATVTAHVAAGVQPYANANAAASGCTFSTTATGFTSTVEGTTTQSRSLDAQLVPPTVQYVKQFPLGREPEVVATRNLRVRITAPVAVNALCYIIFEEG